MLQKVKEQKVEKEESWGQFLWFLVKVAAIIILIRSLLFQPVKIPSGSMRPTLLVGDYLVINKYAYGYSRYSFPLDLKFSGRLFSKEPKVGDIAVFRAPQQRGVDYIKRVIGLPGDRIQVRQGTVYINDQPLKREYVGLVTNPDFTGQQAPMKMYRETLPNGTSYNVFYSTISQTGNDTRVFSVPENHYFMLGDNRNNSLDSRFEVGYVPLENFTGRALWIFFSLSDEAAGWQLWKWPFSLRYSRLLSSVQGLSQADQ